MDCSPPGSSVHSISQARILEWIAISLSRGSSQLRDKTHVSCIAGGFFIAEPPGKPILYTVVYYFIWQLRADKFFVISLHMPYNLGRFFPQSHGGNNPISVFSVVNIHFFLCSQFQWKVKMISAKTLSWHSEPLYDSVFTLTYISVRRSANIIYQRNICGNQLFAWYEHFKNCFLGSVIPGFYVCMKLIRRIILIYSWVVSNRDQTESHNCKVKKNTVH